MMPPQRQGAAEKRRDKDEGEEDLFVRRSIVTAEFPCWKSYAGAALAVHAPAAAGAADVQPVVNLKTFRKQAVPSADGPALLLLDVAGEPESVRMKNLAVHAVDDGDIAGVATDTLGPAAAVLQRRGGKGRTVARRSAPPVPQPQPSAGMKAPPARSAVAAPPVPAADAAVGTARPVVARSIFDIDNLY
jgi:hypothetical protein